MKWLVGLLAAIILAGCSQAQFSADTIPFPENYQVEAARVVANRNVDPGAVRVSYPRPTFGSNAFSPRHWYVCVLGVSSFPKPSTAPKIDELIERIYAPEANAGVHNVVLFFGPAGRPSIREGYDSPLCREGQYGPLVAKPPLT